MQTPATPPASSRSWQEWVSSLSPEEQDALCRATMPRLTKYVPHQPHPPQAAFLLLEHREALYGGAAGGGKSDALLMAALQYVDVPGYSAILFRRTFADLALPGALMDRAEQWLRGTDARWNDRDKTWTFPSGATLTFGYLEHEGDKYRYQGAEFQFVGFDELTQFTETQYRYLFSRLRRLQGSEVPIRMRGATNPGGDGHQWVHARFLVAGAAEGRVFVPAKLDDNPSLDREEYVQSLSELDEVTRRHLLDGDWSVVDRTNALCPEWTKGTALACTLVREPPPMFTAYLVGDIGSQDLTVFLFAFWDFLAAKLHVVHEVVKRDPGTRELGEALCEGLERLWGLARLDDSGRWKKHSSPRVDKLLGFSDIDYRLIRDLREEYDVHLLPTEKQDADAAERACRKEVGDGRITIDPSCATLLATLEGGTWNAKRTDYQRTKELGHADAWKALVYLNRNVRRSQNPYPQLHDPSPLAPRRPVVQSRNVRALSQAFGAGGFKPI